MSATPEQIAEQAQAIANQAQALADGRVVNPLAAAQRLAENSQLLVVWLIAADVATDSRLSPEEVSGLQWAGLLPLTPPSESGGSQS